MIQFFVRLSLGMCLVFTLAMFASKAFGQNSDHSILAFQSMPAERSEGDVVHIYLVDGGRLITLTNQSALYSGIAWSWDGKFLAYSAESCNGICIHNIAANETFSIHDLGAPAANKDPVWRPDGSLTYSIIDPDDTVHVSTINLETGDIREELTRAGESLLFSVTGWSADGRYLAAATNDVFVYDSQTDELLNITDTRHDAGFYPAWSPNGLLAFIFQRDGYWAGIIDISTGEDIALDYLELREESGYSEDEPTWLPDGRLALTIFYTDALTGAYITDILIVDLDTHTIQNATENFDDYVLNPSWSADNRWMTFEGRPADIYIRDIYMRDMLTGALTQITHSDNDELNPIWSP